MRGNIVEAVQKQDASSVAEAKSAWQEQCKVWVRQENGSGKAKHIYRKASFEFLVALENGLRQSCGPQWRLSQFFQPRLLSARNPNSLDLPRLCIAGDCGPDNIASISFLVRSCNTCVDFYPDDSRGCKHDMKAVLKGCNSWQWCLLMVSSFNCWLSPFWECMRFQQVKDAIEEFLAVMSPEEDVLFQHYLEALLRDTGEEHRVCEADIEQQLHEDLKHSACFWQSGRRISLMRFMDFIMKCGEEEKLCHSKLYGMLSALMLMGDLSGNQMGKFDQALRRSATKVDNQGDKPIKQGDEDYNILREYVANQFHLATVVYSEPINQQKVRAVWVASQPALSWWSLADSSQRSVADGRDWILSQAAGRFYDFTDEVISVLGSHSAITYIGFDAHKHPTMLAMNDQHIKVILEDELATMFGRLCTQWLGHRVKRMLHLLRGWPGQCVLFGGSDEQAADAIALLRSDFSLYSAPSLGPCAHSHCSRRLQFSSTLCTCGATVGSSTGFS